MSQCILHHHLQWHSCLCAVLTQLEEKDVLGSWINSLTSFIIWLHAAGLIRIEEQDGMLQGLRHVPEPRPTSAISWYCCWTYCKAKLQLESVYRESLLHLTRRLYRLGGSVRRISFLCRLSLMSLDSLLISVGWCLWVRSWWITLWITNTII